MKKRISILLLIISNIITIIGMELPSATKNPYRRLFVIPDSEPQLDALGHAFIMALVKQEMPLLINYKNFHNLVQEKQKKILEIFKSRNAEQIIASYNNILANPSPSNIDQELKKIEPSRHNFIFYQIAPTRDKWILYTIPNSCFLLFIPLKYIKLLKPDIDINNQQQLASLLKLNLLAFEPILLPAPNTDQQKIVQELDKIDKSLQSKPTACTIQTFENIFLHIPSEIKWNIFEIGHGLIPQQQIAGLPLLEFQKQLLFLNNKINTSLFYYWTCYGGHEKHLTAPFAPFDVLNKLNYTIVSGATTDLPVAVNWLDPRYQKPYILSSGYYIPEPEVRFGDFFRAAENKEPIDKTISYLTTTNAKNIPLVRLPGSPAFSPTDLNKKVFIISRAKALSAFVDNKIFDIPSDKIAVLIAPEMVLAPIILHNKTTNPLEFIALSPAKYHYFTQVSVDNFHRFINNNIIETSRGAEGVGTETERFLYFQNLNFPQAIEYRTYGVDRINDLKILIDGNEETKQFISQENKRRISIPKFVIKIPKTSGSEFLVDIKFYIRHNNKNYEGIYKIGQIPELKFTESNTQETQKILQRFTEYEEKAKQAESLRKRFSKK